MSKTQPMVSVLIPSYNHDKYLKATIESVLNQTFTDFELIIIDDCSSDDSRRIISSFQDKRMRHIFFDENKGVVRTLNTLIKEAKGKYIAALGSDDLFYPDKLEKQVNLLEGNDDIAACFSWPLVIDENGDSKPESEDFPIYIFDESNRSPGKWLRTFYDVGNRFCHSSSLIRRSVFDHIGLYKTAFRQLHDYEYWIRMLNNGYKLHVIPERLLQYRRVKNASSISADTQENNTRLLNEMYFIMQSFFSSMTKELLLDGFGDLMTQPHVETEEELICEKFQVLQKWTVWGNHNIFTDVSFIAPYLRNEGIHGCLKEKYKFLLDDYYKMMGQPFVWYPVSIYKTPEHITLEVEHSALGRELNDLYASNDALKREFDDLHASNYALKREFDDLYAGNYALKANLEGVYRSHSWRLTKPLRVISRIFHKNRG